MSYNAWVEGYVRAIQSPANRYNPHISIKEKRIGDWTEAWLDERWQIANMDNAKPQDMSYYDGAIEALVFAGYDWERDAQGKHTLYMF